MSIRRVDFEYALSKVVSGTLIEFCNKGKCDQSEIDARIDEAWQRLKDKSPHALQRERAAVVTDDATSLEHVQNYLPVGYSAKIEFIDKKRSTLRVVIRGYDIAGFTLDGYVIPRLASGLIVANEFFDGNDRSAENV